MDFSIHALRYRIYNKTMRSSLSKKLETATGLFAVLALAFLMSAEAHAQGTVIVQLPAPPPLKFVPPGERSQLEAARDAKARTRLSVELAIARLMRAEQLTASQQYDGASHELGIYRGILEDALRFLKGQKDQKKLRDVYKRFEISLRAHGPRLEMMRRTTPSEYAFNIKTVADYTRSLRGEALNGFYGDTVIRDAPEDEVEKAPEGEGKTADTSQSSTKEQP
jgi:hypothetical protein